MLLSIIVPVYNEEKTVFSLLEQINNVVLPDGMGKEILVINDGSTDGTRDKLREAQERFGIRLFSFEENRGKAFAVRRGIKEAIGDFILIQDADLEYSPQSYPSLLAPLLNHQAQVVYGSRFLGQIQEMTFINSWANRLTNLTIRLLFNISMTDANTCFKVFQRNVIQKQVLKSEQFGFDSEVTAKLLRQGYRIQEVPIEYVARSKAEGKKMTWDKAVKMYFWLIYYRFAALR